MYAEIKDREWPNGYEEVAYLAKILTKLDSTYKVVVQRKMFSLHTYDSPDFVIGIIRWEEEGPYRNMRRPMLMEMESIEEATGMLRLLISNIKDGDSNARRT